LGVDVSFYGAVPNEFFGVRDEVGIEPFGGQHGLGPIAGDSVDNEVGELHSAMWGDVFLV
jgi:hypothetical protein